MSLSPNNNRITIANIQTVMGDLERSSADGSEATWDSRLRIVDGDSVGLSYNLGRSEKSHTARFDAYTDGNELEVVFGNILPYQPSSSEPVAPLKPGVMREFQCDEAYSSARFERLLEPGRIDRFRLTAIKQTGMVALQVYDGQENIAVPGLTDDVEVAQLFLTACKWAITSPQIGKFKSHSLLASNVAQ